MRDITYEINLKTGAVSGKITPASRVETLTGLAGNFDRRGQLCRIYSITSVISHSGVTFAWVDNARSNFHLL